MSDEKSTPLSSLNNKGDDSNVVNQILDKYNSLEQNPEGTLPPQDKNIPVMEEQFENRDLNKQMFQMASDNTQYKQLSPLEYALKMLIAPTFLIWLMFYIYLFSFQGIWIYFVYCP